MRKHHGDEALLAELNGNGCRSKQRYPSKGHALAVGRRIMRQGDDHRRDNHAQFNAYKCRACSAWHLGHQHHSRLTDLSAIVRRPATPLEHQLAAALAPYLEA